MTSMDYKMVLISISFIIISTLCEGRPISKRTVSEVQLMHNRGEHKLQKERRDWLQMRLRGIHPEQNWSREDPSWDRGVSTRLRKKKLLPKGSSDLDSLTPEEIQFAVDYLELLMKSKKQ